MMRMCNFNHDVISIISHDGNDNNNNDNDNEIDNDKMLKVIIYIVHAFLTICPSSCF